MLIPINLTGGTYKHKSLPLSAQVTRNFWPQKQSDKKSFSELILNSFPGLKLFASQSGGADRGMVEHKGILYKVTGTTLYSVTSYGVHTSLGTISGSNRCIFAPILDSVVIVTDGIVYYWNGLTLTTITSATLESPNSACHINNQIVYDGDGGRFMVSNVGDPSTIDPLNVATAETVADDTIRVYTLRKDLLIFGEKTIQPYWNTGDGNPPFDPIITGNVLVGLGALHSIANNDTVAYFYGDDDQIYVLQGYNAAVISTEPMAREFSQYDVTSDAIGWCMTVGGYNFYVITFPTENKTWVYQEGGEFFEVSSGADGGRWIGNSCVSCFRKNLIADYRNGNIYELDDNTYTENGSAIIRTRDSAPLHGGLLNSKNGNYSGKRLEMNRLELLLETGIGIISGQGSDPVIMMSFSDDGGRTFSTEAWGTVGKSGQYQYRVEWFALGSFENRIIRIRTSDPVPYTIYSAAADIEICI